MRAVVGSILPSALRTQYTRYGLTTTLTGHQRKRLTHLIFLYCGILSYYFSDEITFP
jgi:hypothetical protein